MDGCRRSTQAWTAFALALLLTGTVGPKAVGQTQAESTSASFRKAAEQVRSSIVAVKPGSGFGGWPQVMPPRIAAPGPVNRLPRVRFRSPEFARDGGGSGIVVDADRGCILALDHILEGASQATVVFADGRERSSSQIRRDPQSDLAIVVIDLKGLRLATVRWGDSKALQAGDWVLSIGQPAASEPSLSAGIFSARRFGTGAAPAGELLETDAAVNAINAGGPLVNLAGEVVGINVIAPDHRAVAGMGHAIPAERARRIASDLIETGRVRRAYLGLQIEPGDRAAADRGLAPGAVKVSSVAPGSPAEQSGLRAGDLIVAVEGHAVTGIEMLQSVVEFAPVGEELSLGIERDQARQQIKVRPAAMPDRGVLGVEGLTPPATRRDALRVRPQGGARTSPRGGAPGQPGPSDLEPAPPPDPVAPGQQPSAGPATDRSNAPPKPGSP